MLTDILLILATAQAVTASGITLSTDYVDLVRRRDIGAGNPLVLNTSIVSAPTAAGAEGASIDFRLIGLHDTVLSRALCTATITTNVCGLAAAAAHGYAAGTPVQASAVTTTGLVVNRVYFVTGGATLLTTSFKLSSSLALALAGTSDVVISATNTWTLTHVPTVYAATGPIVRELLLIGRRFVANTSAHVGPNGMPAPRYVFGAAVTTSTFTNGTYSMQLVESATDQLRFYPGGFSLA